MKVHKVRLSMSSKEVKITLITKSPDIQNYKTRIQIRADFYSWDI